MNGFEKDVLLSIALIITLVQHDITEIKLLGNLGCSKELQDKDTANTVQSEVISTEDPNVLAASKTNFFTKQLTR
jgi:hypothetical protein